MTWFTYFCSWDIPINQGKKGLSYYILDLLISGVTVRLAMIISIFKDIFQILVTIHGYVVGRRICNFRTI